MSMARIIAHIDLNAFFARCEEIKNPTLEGKPLAIGHEGRGGIVSTCSYKAREYGVHSAMPMFQAKQLCPNLIVLPVDYRFYRALSATFIAFIKRYTKIVEIASVDECFADFTDVLKNVDDIAYFFKKLQLDLYKETKLKCSIGVANSKFLAKMGSDYKKPMGLTIIKKEDISKILYPLSIDKMFGIGKKTAPRLKEIGIKTIGDLANRMKNDDPTIMKLFGKFYQTAKDWLEGEGNDKVTVEPDDPKSIGNSTTLMYDTSNIEDIKQTFSWLANHVSLRAKKEGKIGSTIQIVVKESDFKVHNKSISFEIPTNDAGVIYNHAISLYIKYFNNLTIRLLGITLQNLIDAKDFVYQRSIFDIPEEEETNTKTLIEEINKKLDKPSLMRASEAKKK